MTSSIEEINLSKGANDDKSKILEILFSYFHFKRLKRYFLTLLIWHNL